MRLVVERADTPPERLQFALFDAIQNLAKTLERTIAFFAEARGVDEDDWHGSFPIATTKSAYYATSPAKKHPRDRALGDIDERAGEIVDSVQPYLAAEPQDEPLGLVQRWSKTDKHRFGNPAITVARGFAVIVTLHRERRIEAFDLWRSVDRRTQRPTVQVGADILDLFPPKAMAPLLPYLSGPPRPTEFEIQVQARFAVAFGKRHDTFVDVQDAFDAIERQVLEPLWRRLDELSTDARA